MSKKIKSEQYYSIKDLEKISGIKAHTIRIWEQRYKVFNPLRTETNIRYYSDADLKKLLNITMLINNGHKISEISTLSNEQLIERINSINSDSEIPLIEKLIVATINFDSDTFQYIINANIEKTGFDKTIEEVFYPLFKRIGILWMTNALYPAHEHFASNFLKQKLFSQIDQLPVPNRKNTDFLLFLPENELHEISLLYSHYILRSKGIKSVYLGQNVPIKDVLKAYNVLRPKYLLCFFVSNVSKSKADSFIHDLLEKTQNTRILISVTNSDKIKLPKDNRLIYINSPYELKKIVNFKQNNQ